MGLVEIPIWVRAGLGITLLTMACSPDVRPPDNRATATAVAFATASALDETRRLGQLLETFNPARLTGFNLEANSNTSVGNVKLGNSSTSNDVIINLNTLSGWLNTCRITTLPNYQMGIEFGDILPSGSPQPLERTFDNEGDISIIRLVPPSYLRDGNNLLKDQITAPENQTNAYKRGMLKANMDLLETMCGLGGIAEKLKQGVTDRNILRMEDSKASQLAQAYLKDLLEGKRPLIFTVRPARKTA